MSMSGGDPVTRVVTSSSRTPSIRSERKGIGRTACDRKTRSRSEAGQRICPYPKISTEGEKTEMFSKVM
jgi:hypothetical protein